MNVNDRHARRRSPSLRLWLYAFAIVLVCCLYWTLSCVVFPPYRVVDLSGLVDAQQPLPANHKGDLAYVTANRVTLLSDGYVRSWSPPRADYPGLRVVAVNNRDDILCTAWHPLKNHYYPALLCVLRDGKWQQLQTPGRSPWDSAYEPVVDINDAGDVAGSYTIDRNIRTEASWAPNGHYMRLVRVTLPALWRPNGVATLFRLDTQWPKCVVMPPGQKAPNLSWGDPESHEAADLRPFEIGEDGTLMCEGATPAPELATPGQMMMCGCGPTKSLFVSISPNGECRIMGDKRRPVSRRASITIQGIGMNYFGVYGQMLDLDRIADIPPNEPAVGTVVVSPTHPVTIRELGTLAGWRRLFHGPRPAPVAYSDAPPPTLAEVGKTNLAVKADGKRWDFLEDLISPFSHWQLITATNIDRDGRILCIGKHKGKLKWCMLVPRGVTFRLGKKGLTKPKKIRLQSW